MSKRKHYSRPESDQQTLTMLIDVWKLCKRGKEDPDKLPTNKYSRIYKVQNFPRSEVLSAILRGLSQPTMDDVKALKRYAQKKRHNAKKHHHFPYEPGLFDDESELEKAIRIIKEAGGKVFMPVTELKEV